jgi:putative transposase
MSRNYYSEINLHITWHTIGSRALLVPTIEAETHRFLRQRMIETPGVFVHEIGGTETHIHIAMTIPPTLTISDYIGQLKGASSHHINHTNPTRDKLLEWQSGYGVVSFGTRNLNWVRNYVRNQKAHHAKGRIVDRLERINALESDAHSQGVNAASSEKARERAS